MHQPQRICLIGLSDATLFSAEDMRQLERNAFEISWLPNAVKDGYLAELDAYGR